MSKTEKVYLKDVFDIDTYMKEGKNKLFVVSGVCSGKSTYVTEVLAKKGSVLYVTSRIAKVKEDATRTDFKLTYEWGRDDNRTIMTNAKLAYEINVITYSEQFNVDDFLNLFDYIVIDEVHSIATDSTFAPSSFDLLAFIDYASEKNKTILAMTGTPEPIEYFFKEKNWTVLDYRNKCNYVHPQEIKLIKKNRIIDKIINTNDKIIYFSNHVDTIVKLCKEILSNTDINANEIATVVAQGRLTEFAESLEKEKTIGKENAEKIISTTKVTYDSIIKNQLIPDECKILISTSTLREGIDIKNESITMFCENHILSNLIQFFGRVRGSANTVYIIEDSTSHPVITDAYSYEYSKDLIRYENMLLNERYREVDVTKLNEKNERIKFVTNQFRYIYFNYIRNSFEVFHVKYNEEQRLLEQKKWKQIITKYCDSYRIPYAWFYLKELYQNILTDISLHKTTKFYKDDRIVLLNMINIAYGIKDKQIETINEQLKKKKSDIRIEKGRDFTTKGTDKKRGETYWTVENINDCTYFLESYKE